MAKATSKTKNKPRHAVYRSLNIGTNTKAYQYKDCWYKKKDNSMPFTTHIIHDLKEHYPPFLKQFKVNYNWTDEQIDAWKIDELKEKAMEVFNNEELFIKVQKDEFGLPSGALDCILRTKKDNPLRKEYADIIEQHKAAAKEKKKQSKSGAGGPDETTNLEDEHGVLPDATTHNNLPTHSTTTTHDVVDTLDHPQPSEETTKRPAVPQGDGESTESEKSHQEEDADGEDPPLDPTNDKLPPLHPTNPDMYAEHHHPTLDQATMEYADNVGDEMDDKTHDQFINGQLTNIADGKEDCEKAAPLPPSLPTVPPPPPDLQPPYPPPPGPPLKQYPPMPEVELHPPQGLTQVEINKWRATAVVEWVQKMDQQKAWPDNGYMKMKTTLKFIDTRFEEPPPPPTPRKKSEDDDEEDYSDLMASFADVAAPPAPPDPVEEADEQEGSSSSEEEEEEDLPKERGKSCCACSLTCSQFFYITLLIFFCFLSSFLYHFFSPAKPSDYVWTKLRTNDFPYEWGDKWYFKRLEPWNPDPDFILRIMKCLTWLRANPETLDNSKYLTRKGVLVKGAEKFRLPEKEERDPLLKCVCAVVYYMISSKTGPYFQPDRTHDVIGSAPGKNGSGPLKDANTIQREIDSATVLFTLLGFNNSLIHKYVLCSEDRHVNKGSAIRGKATLCRRRHETDCKPPKLPKTFVSWCLNMSGRPGWDWRTPRYPRPTARKARPVKISSKRKAPPTASLKDEESSAKCRLGRTGLPMHKNQVDAMAESLEDTDNMEESNMRSV